jgi:thioredoxin-related protein
MKTLATVLFLATSTLASASGSHSHDSSAQNESKSESKWLTNYQQAQALSKKTGKPILMDFTGSDWCGWCIRLEDEVFSKSEFKKYAEKNVILLELDFPQRKAIDPKTKEQNEMLAKMYGVRGFPTILLTDHNGKVIAQTGYQQGGPKAYIKHIKDLLAKK